MAKDSRRPSQLVRLANRKRPTVLPTPSSDDQHHAEAIAEADVARIGHEMHERREQAERHQQGAGIDSPERCERMASPSVKPWRDAVGPPRLPAIAVGSEPVELRRRRTSTPANDGADGREAGEDEVGLAPANACDQLVCQRRADQGADADPATARPLAVPRRRTNQRWTAVTLGT